MREIFRATRDARDELVDLESVSDEELDRLQREFHELRQHYHAQAERATHEVHRRRGGPQRRGEGD